ncbi:CGNR zinc finger domain-containing protein [Saccharothrix coeruleofusca]|uniref:Zinc finger CGNR domain-containing protein n=1 Tax=Saccharothrix coeruleofusca TaxID=33919 RepID=A0A918EEI6_9PSEU|nr:CGNR zinc finger domain-containing protein [Saccharothrix coeruleofusca]MBP2339581.1 hypothetical protein [Saccharothrix coeruleofusca]GGP56684.1 hypothetical protein GCM10010185_31150 [Saccharothrix coeruleofusca]
MELLLAFLNTRDPGLGTDVLDSAASWRAWVAERDLGEAGDLDEVRAVRAALRHSLGEPRERPDPLPATGVITVDLSHGVPTLASAEAVGAVLGAAARLAVLGSWERFKLCQAEGCGSAFYDRSRNRSRTWCSMQVCGNREKARNWRERARALSIT